MTAHRVAQPKFRSSDLCPDVLNHTPAPKSYLSWHEWAEEMGKTHDQQRCPRCGFLTLWIERQGEQP